MTFPGYPLADNFTNSSPVQDLHPAAHNDVAGAANDLQDQLTAENAWDRRGTGSPEGVVTAPIGTTWRRTDGGTNTAVYRKETGAGNTGWVAITDGGVGGDASTLGGQTLAQVRARTSHTGTQDADTITDGADNKVFTATEKTKLAGVEINATFNDLAATIDDFDEAVVALGMAREIEITWNAGDATSKLEPDEYFSQGLSDTATSGFTRTIVETAPPGGGNVTVSTARLRVACPSGLTAASTRTGLPITGSTSTDDEIESVLLSHTVGAQLGHFHRKGVHPSTGNPMAYAFWMDALFLVDSFWNMNTWENNVAGNTLVQGSANDSGSADLTGAQHWVDVLASSKTGAVVTLTLPRDHGIPVGDNILVACTSISDTAVVVTATPDARTITYTSTTTAATPVPVGGAGQLMSRNTVYPLKVKSRLEGTTLRGKVWPFERMDEPDWSSINNALTFINTGTNQAAAGESGIIVAHLNNDTFSVDLGSVIWRNLDA